MGRKIRVRLKELRASVSPRDAAVVAPLLAERVHNFSAESAGVVGRQSTFSLGRSEGGDFFFASKLAPFVADRLRQRGQQVKVAYPNWPMPVAPDPAVASKLTGPAGRLLARPGCRFGALVRFAGAVHPHHVVPDLLRTYPTARAVVGVTNRHQLRGWLRRLREAELGRPVVGPAEYLEHGLPSPIVLVCSLAQLDNCPPENFDLAIVPDARPLRGIDGRPPEEYDPRDEWEHRPVFRRDYRLLRHCNIPAFGFVPRNFRLTRGEEKRLWALFTRTVELGFVRPARVDVVVVRGPRAVGLTPDPETDPAGYKKWLWAEEDRNRTVAEHAARLADGGGDILPPFGTKIPAGGRLRVVVLVESSTHAGRLAALLPGWVIRGNDSHSTTPAGPLDRVIATELWAITQRRLDADVVVDARGWNPLTLPGFPPHVPDGIRVVTVVDVGDRGGMDKTGARLREYRRRGWAVHVV